MIGSRAAPAPAAAARGRFEVVELTPESAALASELIARVDGSFADPALHDPAAVAAMVAGGDRQLFVAVDAAGVARGMIGIAFSLPTRAMAEVGLIVVDPALGVEVRGRVLHALMGAVTARARRLAQRDGLRGLVSSEVTSHTHSQRLVERAGFVTTGIYLASPRPAGAPGGPRRAGMHETISARCFVRRVEPYAVAPPLRLTALLGALYVALRLPVAFAPPARPQGETAIRETYDERRGRTLLELTAVGADAPDVLRDRLAGWRGRARGLHVVLALDRADLEPAVDVLYGAGLRYAALLPCWREHDALVLQSVDPGRADLRAGDLHAPLARRILREILPATAHDRPANGTRPP